MESENFKRVLGTFSVSEEPAREREREREREKEKVEEIYEEVACNKINVD